MSSYSNKSMSGDSDDWSEGEAEIPAEVNDSMLTATYFLDDSEPQYIYNFAPGESNKPLSLFREEF